MLARAVGVVAVGALGATAFVLPPGSSLPDSDSAPFSPINTKSQHLEFPCPSCRFSTAGRNDAVTEGGEDIQLDGGPNNLLFNFSISDDNKHLELNRVSIFPAADADFFKGRPLYAIQKDMSASAAQIASGDAETVPVEITSLGLSFENERPVSRTGDSVAPIRLDIYSIHGHSFPLPAIGIDVLQSRDGELSILKAEKKPQSLDPTPSSSEIFRSRPLQTANDCRRLPRALCTFKTIMQSKFARLRQGHFGRPHHHQPGPGARHHPHGPLDTHFTGRPHINTRPHHHDHHGRPHHMRPHGHHHRHGLVRTIAHELAAVLVPVVAGITVGLIVSLLGLLVGRFISFLWITIVRGGVRGNASRVAAQAAANEEAMPLRSEKSDRLGEACDPPPVYEAAPAYEDVEKEVK